MYKDRDYLGKLNIKQVKISKKIRFYWIKYILFRLSRCKDMYNLRFGNTGVY